MKMLKMTLMEVIISITVLSMVVGITTYSIYKERSNISVETYRGMEGFTVDAESAEDVYNVLDGMHTQVLENIDPNSKVGMWLADKMDEMRQKFDLDEDELQEP